MALKLAHPQADRALLHLEPMGDGVTVLLLPLAQAVGVLPASTLLGLRVVVVVQAGLLHQPQRQRWTWPAHAHSKACA